MTRLMVRAQMDIPKQGDKNLAKALQVCQSRAAAVHDAEEATPKPQVLAAKARRKVAPPTPASESESELESDDAPLVSQKKKKQKKKQLKKKKKKKSDHEVEPDIVFESADDALSTTTTTTTTAAASRPPTPRKNKQQKKKVEVKAKKKKQQQPAVKTEGKKKTNKKRKLPGAKTGDKEMSGVAAAAASLEVEFREQARRVASLRAVMPSTSPDAPPTALMCASPPPRETFGRSRPGTLVGGVGAAV